MLNFNKALHAFTLAAACICFASCGKDLDKINPSYPTVDNYFTTSAQLQNATNAIYSDFRSGYLTGRFWFFIHDLRADDVAGGKVDNGSTLNQLLGGTTQSTNDFMTQFWKGLYIMIHRSNTVITNKGKVTDNAAIVERCLAEAKFFRAWAYYELSGFWGPVPVYTQTVDARTGFQPRLPLDSVYKQIITDLLDAKKVLPLTFTGADLGRVTKGAVNMVLAKVYMQRGAAGDYQNAKDVLQEMINSKVYKLVDNYSDNFLEETELNGESILEAIHYDRGDRKYDASFTGDGPAVALSTLRNQEYNPIAWANVKPSDKYLNDFEDITLGDTKTDPRFKASVYLPGDMFNNNTETLTDAMMNVSTSNYHGRMVKTGWRKYNLIYKQPFTIGSKGAYGGINQRVFRYADALLMMAECNNELNNIPEAVSYLNMIRKRPSVAMPEYPTVKYPVTTKEQVQTALMHERFIELGCEEVRAFDLLRWRKKGYLAGALEPFPYFKANKDELLPIPQLEVDNNPDLNKDGIKAQNPNY